MSDVTCNREYSLILYPVLSNNCDIELILSDIPFISVGILAFGVTALFLTIRRFTFSIVSLYFSVLLSFAATIIDLTQTLIRDLSHVTISPLVTTREILLALSLALRILFYWLYVSEPPIGEQRTPSFQRKRYNFLSLNPQDELHSGNWARWGVAGSYAKFALLATIPAITALQIIWRVFQRHNGYSPVYAADITLEVVVSVLLLLKLLLNTVATSSILQTHTFKECGFPILALIFNIGISIGGLVYFAFTESTVGRLLQGTELFILIVFMTIHHFSCHKRILSTTHMRDLAAEKVELPEQLRASTFRLSPPAVSTPRVSTLSSPKNQGRNVNTDAVRHSILASVGRATPLVSWRLSRTKSNQDEDKAKLWDQNEAEKGALDPPDAGRGSAGPQSMFSVASAMDEEFIDWRDIVNDSVPYTLATAMPDSLSVSSRSREGSLSSEQIWNAIRVDAPRRSSKSQPLPLSLIAIPATETSSNGSGAAVATTAPLDLPSQDLPIYELNGVTGPFPTLSNSRLSSTSLDQLKDLQNELEKMMATLRSFSSSSPGSPTFISSSINDSNDDRQTRQPSSTVRRSSSTGQQSSSTCARTMSEFSLSNFPSPPPPQFHSLPTPLPALNLRLKEEDGRRARFGSPHDPNFRLPLPPRIPAALTDVPSSPHSDFTSDSPFYEDNGTLSAAAGRPSRSSPRGTQYEITSFIDDLTSPVGHRGPMTGMSLDESEGNPLNLAGIIEDRVSREASPHLPTTPSRPSPLRVAALMGFSPSSTRSRLSGVPISEEQGSEPVQRGIRPLILPSMTISSPSSHSQALNISSGVRSSRGMFGLPPRPGFRVPKPLPQNIQAFGRARPPPLLLRSDDEYFAKRAE